MRKTAQERFDEKYCPEPMSGCWLWTHHCDPKGYGMIWLKGSPRKAHRISWELHRYPIPKGMFICHRCDTPACVNPEHLFLGTHTDNMRDMASKGRGAGVKATRSDVELAVSMSREGIGYREIARRLGFGASTIRYWCKGWRRAGAH